MMGTSGNGCRADVKDGVDKNQGKKQEISPE
jgi:hypothetical protein